MIHSCVFSFTFHFGEVFLSCISKIFWSFFFLNNSNSKYITVQLCVFLFNFWNRFVFSIFFTIFGIYLWCDASFFGEENFMLHQQVCMNKIVKLLICLSFAVKLHQEKEIENIMLDIFRWCRERQSCIVQRAEWNYLSFLVRCVLHFPSGKKSPRIFCDVILTASFHSHLLWLLYEFNCVCFKCCLTYTNYNLHWKFHIVIIFVLGFNNFFIHRRIAYLHEALSMCHKYGKFISIDAWSRQFNHCK